MRAPSEGICTSNQGHKRKGKNDQYGTTLYGTNEKKDQKGLEGEIVYFKTSNAESPLERMCIGGKEIPVQCVLDNMKGEGGVLSPCSIHLVIWEVLGGGKKSLLLFQLPIVVRCAKTTSKGGKNEQEE